MAFSFNPYPYRYSAKFKTENSSIPWEETFIELPNKGTDEKSLNEEAQQHFIKERNYTGNYPMVTFSSQYGLGCFEGLKAYPQANGSLALFRADRNAKRFFNSMKALYMPPFEQEKFIHASKKILSLSYDKGFFPLFDKKWKDDNFSTAKAVYLRPFTYTEGGLGLNISENPWVIIYTSEVGSYLEQQKYPTLIVSDKIRAMPKGTGGIKCNANYVISILAKQQAKQQGFTEALFLDYTRKYVEECSSCNIFFVLHDKTIVTPALGDTILAGITRASIITIAHDLGYTVEERKITIDEVFTNVQECFATGTAVGVEYFSSIAYNEKTVVFGDGTIGDISRLLQTTLKNIQYGVIQDTHNWLVPIH